MSTESLNRTSDHNLETPSINLDVLKRKKEIQIPKKKCALINLITDFMFLKKKTNLEIV